MISETRSAEGISTAVDRCTFVNSAKGLYDGDAESESDAAVVDSSKRCRAPVRSRDCRTITALAGTRTVTERWFPLAGRIGQA